MIIKSADVNAYINDFATRCFRNNADRDYIVARMCYRGGLFSQFHWAALQAFEKYYKAIFLYNRIKAKNVRHSLSKAKDKTKELPFNLELSESSVKLLEHLDTYGPDRYLVGSYFVKGPKLIELDRAVWELRRYCSVIDYSISEPGREPIHMLASELKTIKQSENKPYQSFRLSGGLLESIVDNKNHPARNDLIWQNGFYGKSRRKIVIIPSHVYAENSPLSLYPELLDHLEDYIHLPDNLKEACRDAAKKKNG